MQDDLDVLAQELVSAAKKYCGATGKTFDVHFSFVDITSIDGSGKTIEVNVEVESAISASA